MLDGCNKIPPLVFFFVVTKRVKKRGEMSGLVLGALVLVRRGT